MTIKHSHRRAGLAALLTTGVLLLGACGGGDDDDEATDDQTTEDGAGDDAAADNADPSVPTPSIDPDAPDADSNFCQGAMAAITASVNPNAEEGDASLEAAEALDAPEEIAEAWNNVLSTSRDMADIDYTDPEASAEAQQAYEQIADDQAAVITYLQEGCGIDLGAGSSGSTTVPVPPTTGA